MIYFIQEKEAPFRIKMGFSKNPVKRISVISAYLPQGMKILKVIEGDIEDERWFHNFLRAYRIKGKREWYHPESDFLMFIETGDIKYVS